MRFQPLVLRLGLVALAVGVCMAGCKSSSTTSSDGGKAEGDLQSAAAKRVSANRLKQIGIALHNYHSDNGKLPSAGATAPAKAADQFAAMKAQSWRVETLPYVEQANLYNLIRAEFAMNPLAPLPEAVTRTSVRTYQLPGAEVKGTKTHYRAFVGGGAAFDYGVQHRIPASFPDGLSNTIFVVEAAEPVDWYSVNELVYDPKKPLPKLGVFPGGFQALMGDGSVHWFPSDTPEATIRAMITRAGGETIDTPSK
jgi:hypothetical protein